MLPLMQCPLVLEAPLMQFVVVGTLPVMQELSARSPPLPVEHHMEPVRAKEMRQGLEYTIALASFSFLPPQIRPLNLANIYT